MTWVLRTPKTTATAARSARSSPGACSTGSNGSGSGWPASRPSAAPMLPHGCAPTAASSGRPGIVEPQVTGAETHGCVSAYRYAGAIVDHRWQWVRMMGNVYRQWFGGDSEPGPWLVAPMRAGGES